MRDVLFFTCDCKMFGLYHCLFFCGVYKAQHSYITESAAHVTPSLHSPEFYMATSNLSEPWDAGPVTRLTVFFS